MATITQLESKEPNKEEIEKILKQNVIKIFNQIKKGCSNAICPNIYCYNNIICQNSK